ncbi:MAG TPA: DUF364 domain-containing protein [Anaerolineales bacterium]|nr:DUF364 domain-containing protein [Anaerolineales bacterium]
MTILDELIASLPGDVPVRSVPPGVHWTVVCSRRCGMAATLLSEHLHREKQVREVGSLHLKSARQLAELAYSAELLEASIGIAAINSLLAVAESQAVEVNASEVAASHGRGKNVALIGHFPFIEKLRGTVGKLWVFEQNPTEGEYPAESATELLRQADVVAITGSTLVNHTLDGLLALCNPDSTVMMLGPSTPLSPVLFDYGVDILSGTRVVDEMAVLRTVGQGPRSVKWKALSC